MADEKKMEPRNPSGGSLWQDKFLWVSYDLAREGATESGIAAQIGISIHTLHQWEKKKPLFAYALKRGRKIHKRKIKDDSATAIEGWFWEHLSPDERQTWKKLKRFDRAKRGKEVINALMEKRGKIFRQHLFIHAMVHTNYQVTKACRLVGISLTLFEKWKREDPEFTKLFLSIQEAKKDRLENAFYKLTDAHETTAVLHGLKTMARDRGYGEKSEVSVNVSGQIQHNLVQLDVEALPPELQQQLLEHIRKTKQVESTVINTVPQLTGAVGAPQYVQA